MTTHPFDFDTSTGTAAVGLGSGSDAVDPHDPHAAHAAQGPQGASEVSGVAGLRGWLGQLAVLERDVSDAERVDLLRVLEELKSGAAAAQVRVTVDLDVSQRSAQAGVGVRSQHQGRGVASQVALARRDSPFKGSRHVGFARALVSEMPHALNLLSQGVLSEWRATLLVRETACLSAQDRSTVDEVLCADPRRLEGCGDHQVVAEVKKLAYQLDPASVVRRVRRAESERRVSIRPAPDTMTYVTGLLPMAQGVAVYAALKKATDTLISSGDDRTRGQIMADLLVERVTGQTEAAAVPISVSLVMTDKTLLGTDTEPAQVPGYGPVPAWLGRSLVKRAAETGTDTGTGTTSGTETGIGVGAGAASDTTMVWVRRLYTDPVTGELVAMDSRARCFPNGLRDFIDVRDLGTCRTPWCDAPIRHRDHAEAVEDGGETTAGNGQGLCQQCNHAKQAPGWKAQPRPGPRHTVATTTPTGHTYQSTAPPLPGAPSQQEQPQEQPLPQQPPPRSMSRLETYFHDLILAS